MIASEASHAIDSLSEETSTERRGKPPLAMDDERWLKWFRANVLESEGLLQSHDDDDAEQALARVGREISELAAALGDTGETEPAVGEAAGGLIRVTARRGRLSAVELDPQAMRLTSFDLAEELLRAVNAALAEAEARYSAAGAAPDLSAIAAELASTQHHATENLRRIAESMSQARLRQEG